MPTPFTGSSNPADICSYQLGWRGRPYYQTTIATDDYIHDLTLNSRGMHDSEHLQEKADNSYRILMLGDSFTQAVQVKEAETAHQVLEDMLNSQQHKQQQYELISAGVGGWGTGQQLLYYRDEGRLYRPDMVILMFFMGNDIQDNLPGRGVTADGINCYSPYFVLDGDNFDATPWLYAPGLPPPTGQIIVGQKITTNLLGQLYQSSRLYTQLEPLLSTAPIKATMLDYYSGEELFNYGLNLTLELVKQLHTEVAKDGVEFMVVLINPAELVAFARMNAAEREIIYQESPVMRFSERVTPPNQFLQQRFSAQGIKVLDLLPIFTLHIDKTGQSLHFQHDKHWNTAGNHLAGEAIYNWMVENIDQARPRRF